MADKAKYWTGVLYPENMVPDWKENIGDLLQVPYCYCVHDKDLLKEKEENRKVHIHIIIAFNNTTTKKHALEVLKALGENAINTCQSINDIKHMYNYLIHDTEDSRKKGKYLYDTTERICGNNFDIGLYEQVSQEEKDRMIAELEDIILNESTCNYMIIFRKVAEMGMEYRSAFRGHSSHFYRLLQGNAMYKRGDYEGFRKDLPERKTEAI